METALWSFKLLIMLSRYHKVKSYNISAIIRALGTRGEGTVTDWLPSCFRLSMDSIKFRWYIQSTSHHFVYFSMNVSSSWKERTITLYQCSLPFLWSHTTSFSQATTATQSCIHDNVDFFGTIDIFRPHFFFQPLRVTLLFTYYSWYFLVSHELFLFSPAMGLLHWIFYSKRYNSLSSFSHEYLMVSAVK